MRGMILHCKSFAYVDSIKSTRPKGIQPVGWGQLSSEKPVLVVLTCIEKGDTETEIKAAVERVDTLNKEFHNRGNITVLPFAHLSNQLEVPEKAITLCKKFEKSLRELHYNTQLGSFGTHKRAKVDIFGYPASVSYFQFPKNRL